MDSFDKIIYFLAANLFGMEFEEKSNKYYLLKSTSRKMPIIYVIRVHYNKKIIAVIIFFYIRSHNNVMTRG